VWNVWRKTNLPGRPDLSRANLSSANLRKADLSRAELQETNLFDAHLSEANLSEVYLNRANLSEADLSGAYLNGADLSSANLRLTTLHGADLRGAIIGNTLFIDLDLSEVQGLDAVYHQGPSPININTLIKSKGKIPDSFLRGCGIPDSFIEYLPSLIGAMQPIQFYSCFISYSTKDKDFAQRLYERMQSHHLRVWFADEDMKGGHKLHEQIDQAIRVHDKLVLVLSEQSIQSEWVMTEIRKARKAELRDKRRKLFPIRLVDMDTLRDWECFDADTGKDLAVEVREYFIPDFTQWKDHDSFERAFARFLKDLQATEAPPVPRAIDAPSFSSNATAGASESIIEIKKRRLRLLEEQQARKGQDTEPHIVMEIEDLRREIAQIEGR
jgi:hypothetical protein